jgi:hypothetical protein
MRIRIRILSGSFAAVLLVAAAPLAQAQMMLNQMGRGNRTAAPPPATKTAPPPALPGAASSSDAAPANRPASDMEPNEALFDAINRGDIGAAREALGRGADLQGRNILGMTPLELSIDLGRNDITFVLLSMRAGDEKANRQATAAQATAKPNVTKQAKQAPPRAAPRVATAPPAPSQTARLYSGDGGTPNPNAGFLGFDSSRR